MLNKTEHIKLEFKGFDSWYVIDSIDYDNSRFYMLENEYLGDEVPWAIIDEHKRVLVESATCWGDLYDEWRTMMGVIYSDSLGVKFTVFQEGENYIIKRYTGVYDLWKTAYTVNGTPLDGFETRTQAERYMRDNLERIM